jgi:hypothetical protein
MEYLAYAARCIILQGRSQFPLNNFPIPDAPNSQTGIFDKTNIKAIHTDPGLQKLNNPE